MGLTSPENFERRLKPDILVSKQSTKLVQTHPEETAQTPDRIIPAFLLAKLVELLYGLAFCFNSSWAF